MRSLTEKLAKIIIEISQEKMKVRNFPDKSIWKKAFRLKLDSFMIFERESKLLVLKFKCFSKLFRLDFIIIPNLQTVFFNNLQTLFLNISRQSCSV